MYVSTLLNLEKKLGNPSVDSPMSFAAAIQRDLQETYPRDAIDYLGQLGISDFHIPPDLGGHTFSLERLQAASYVIGRRDPAVALSHGLQMWSQLAWMVGSDHQKKKFIELIEKNEQICLAATEVDHGADLLSTECRADPIEGGFEITGEKWPIGSASNCGAAFVLARTKQKRGPRSLSWFVLWRDALDSPACQRLDKVSTVGMRSSDLSGLSFQKLRIKSDCLVGELGQGLELMLKLSQITRPLVASLSLGPGDTALRLAVDFARSRKLYGQTAMDLPTVRETLVIAWTNFLISEVLGLSVLRGAHFHPRSLPSSSLVAKILIPNLIHQSIDRARLVLGARSFIRNYADGVFDKMVRDQTIVPIFDGSTDLCRHQLATLLPLLLTFDTPLDEETVIAASDLNQPVPKFDYSKLSMITKGEDDFLQALPQVVEKKASGHPLERPARLISNKIKHEVIQLRGQIDSGKENVTLKGKRSAQLAKLTERYAKLHALSACVTFGLCNNEDLITSHPCWLWMCASQLLKEPVQDSPNLQEVVDQLSHELIQRSEGGSLFSAFTNQK